MVRAFEGCTARVRRAEFPYLRRFAKVVWSPSYFAASVGYVSESTVRRDIAHQWDAKSTELRLYCPPDSFGTRGNAASARSMSRLRTLN